MSARNFGDAAKSMLDGFYAETLRILRSEYQIEWEAPPVGGYITLRDLVDSFDEQVAGQAETSLKAVRARDTLAALRDVVALVEGVDAEADADAEVLTAKLVICATRLGFWASHAGLVEAGLWDDFAEAKWKLYRMGSTQRGRQAPWEAAFAPRAVSYCEGKQKVTLGQLTNLARVWADEERSAGRNPQLPSTDDGIKAGLKRMEAAGLLSIPGRTEGGAGVGTAE